MSVTTSPASADHVLSKSLRLGHSPSCAVNSFCKASYISVPLLPLSPCPASDVRRWADLPWELRDAQLCLTVSEGTLITSPSFPGLAAPPRWQVCHYLTSNMAIHPYPDLTLHFSNCKSSFYFKKIKKFPSLLTLVDTDFHGWIISHSKQ